MAPLRRGWLPEGLCFCLVAWGSPQQVHCFAGAMRMGAIGLGQAIEVGVLKRYPVGTERVIKAWDRLRSGLEFKEETPFGVQQAGSYLPGLSARPWHEESSFEWAVGLENRAEEIQKEFAAVSAGAELKKKGTNVWAPPVVEEAINYGPEWKTLVLQDRRWDPINCALFPVTTRIVRDELKVPSCEVFFARQDPHSGIKPHTDNTNFIMTAHLGLQVPEGQCWIKVGNETREWRNGKMLVFDTSFYHSTANDADSDRVVLLIRFWHPELSKTERDALSFIFAALEDNSVLDDANWTPESWSGVVGSSGGADEALGSFREEILAESSNNGVAEDRQGMSRQARRKAERDARKADAKRT